jgi:copper chaperone
MNIQLKVPSIVCQVCADNIIKAITNNIPSAQVNINLDTKIVTVKSQADETTIKEIILDAGHTLE